jgi:hypothetical protein
MAAAWSMQRILQEHVGSGEVVDDAEIAGLSQKSVNHRPTMALFSSSLDMMDFLALSAAVDLGLRTAVRLPGLGTTL